MLYETLGDDQGLFLAANRLFVLLWLKLTEVVEHGFKLDLEFAGPDVLHLDFEGQRRNVYSNVEAPAIRVEGTCSLRR